MIRPKLVTSKFLWIYRNSYDSKIVQLRSEITQKFRENNYGVCLWESFPLAPSNNRKAIVSVLPDDNWYNNDINFIIFLNNIIFFWYK